MYVGNSHACLIVLETGERPGRGDHRMYMEPDVKLGRGRLK